MDFQNTMPLPPALPAWQSPAAAPAVRPAAPASQPLAVAFTGSGSEYFRIWIVNLLLTLVTLGLYYPFAKVRRLRYFHANTLVGGHALGFHGDPWKMLRGFLLMVVFAGAYAGAGHFSPLAGALAGVLFLVLWPALWQSSLRFRLANTSWRGLRMRFGGNLRGAYGAVAPMFAPIALMLLAGAGAGRPGQPEPSTLQTSVLVLAALAAIGLLPYTLARLKRYQHGGYEWAGEAARLEVPTRQFYGLGLRTFLVCLVPLLALALAVMLTVGGLGGGRPLGRGAAIALVLLPLVSYLAIFFVTQTYWSARLQDLVWNGTHSHRLHFGSRLGALALFKLTLKNFLLTIVTLGLYRPFAVIATARLRIDAMRITAALDLEQRAAAIAAHGAGDASGDAAGDLLGIDIGL